MVELIWLKIGKRGSSGIDICFITFCCSNGCGLTNCAGGGGEIGAMSKMGLFEGLNVYEKMPVGLGWSTKKPPLPPWFWTWVIVGEIEPTDEVSRSEPVDMLIVFIRFCCCCCKRA